MSDDQNTRFARSEYDRIFIGDDELLSLCRANVDELMFDPSETGTRIADRIIGDLGARRAMSLLRVGNGEGNAVSLTKEPPLHSLQLSTFYHEFLSQNRMRIPQEAAVALARQVRTALTSADVIGFRAFRAFWGPEAALIEETIEDGDFYAALGILYARELLQNGLRAGVWRTSLMTHAWVHLDLIPHLGRILEAAESVIVISGRSEIADELRSRVGARLAAFITVPVQGFVPQSEEQSHFGGVFPVVLEALRRDLRGMLVLVGAGLFGKVYCHTAKLHGAVAVDLGSTFDVLCGLKTRPVHDFIDLNALRWLKADG